MSDTMTDDALRELLECWQIWKVAKPPDVSFKQFAESGMLMLKWTGPLCEEVLSLRAERDKLARFKKWVHDYLDAKGIPHHPPGTHGAEGCRIGDRMDYLFAEVARLRAERDAAVAEAVRGERERARAEGRWRRGLKPD